MVYSHVGEGGSHSFVNYGTIGSDPGNWYHLLGIWDDVSNLHSFYVNGSASSAGTTLNNLGSTVPLVFSYDSYTEIAHAACWATAFSSTEAVIAKNYDPLTFKRDYLRGYWPLSRGAGRRQCAPWSPYGTGDGQPTLTVGTPALLTDDGPLVAINWTRLDLPPPTPYSWTYPMRWSGGAILLPAGDRWV